MTSSTSSTQPRRPMPAPEPGLGVRPGAGVLGLARAEPPAAQRDASADGTLHVGEGIQLKGEIQACKTLIVEGRVEASLDAGELMVRRGGCYDGTATVRAARIGGSFSGTLTVDGLLTVEAGGRVSGTLRYRELRIEQGGRISGEVDLVSEETRAKANGKAAGERIMEGAAAR